MENDHKLTLRLSKQDMALLRSHTAKTRLSQSAYLRMLIRGLSPKAYPPEPFFAVMDVLRTIGNSLCSRGCLNSGECKEAVQELLTEILRLEALLTSPEMIYGNDCDLVGQG